MVAPAVYIVQHPTGFEVDAEINYESVEYDEDNGDDTTTS